MKRNGKQPVPLVNSDGLVEKPGADHIFSQNRSCPIITIQCDDTVMLEARDFLLRHAVFGPNGARSGHNARRTRQLDLHITGIDTRVKVIQTLVVRTLHKRFFSHCERIAGQVDIQAVNLSTGFRDKRIAVRKNLLWKALGRDRVMSNC